MSTPLLNQAPKKSIHADSSGVSQDPKWDNVQIAWDTVMAEPEGKRVFFDHIVIAGDGGLSEIGTKEELWYNSRYFSSVILLVFVVYNIYFLISGDVGIMLGETVDDDPNDGQADMESDYLISKSLMNWASPGTTKHLEARVVIAGIELLILTFYFIVLGQDAYAAIFKTGHAKWKGISEVAWIDLPDLSLFSSMKLLAYIVPQKISYDINYALFYDVRPKWQTLGLIVLTRPLCLIVGMDTFLVKYRLASQYIMIEHATLHDIMAGIIFLNQVLGVVNINFTIKSRLYRFVFGGEDGIMSEREVVRQDVWESFVAYKIFLKYPPVKAVALMLSWCDDDFQMLALNESEEGTVPSGSRNSERNLV